MPLVSVLHDDSASATPVKAGNAPQNGAALHASPEFLKRGKAIFNSIAGDDGRIDGADRGADDPVGLDARLVQRLIDAALIGAERAAALQHERHLAAVVVADLVDCLQRGEILRFLHHG